jgi:hypothetical protein
MEPAWTALAQQRVHALPVSEDEPKPALEWTRRAKARRWCSSWRSCARIVREPEEAPFSPRLAGLLS